MAITEKKTENTDQKDNSWRKKTGNAFLAELMERFPSQVKVVSSVEEALEEVKND